MSTPESITLSTGIKTNSIKNKITKKMETLKIEIPKGYEIANILGVPIHTISGRFSELKAQQKIYQTSSKKIGSKSYAVYSKTIN